MTYTTYV